LKKEQCEQKGRFGSCPYVTSQKLLQGKWAILIMHALSRGPKRFGELQRELDITQATLSSQLKNLESEGLINRTLYPEVPPRVEYSLTEIGREFQPVLDSIEVWGRKYIEYLHTHRD
jgi:DNA-binding HxlR family transcriptional regulator